MSRPADPRAKIALLRAAEDVFAERGLAGARIEEIAKRAGLSKGAFYLHFESKEAVLKHIVESFLARCGGYFAPPSHYPDLPDEPGALLSFCFERDVQIYDFLWANRAILRILPTCQGQYDYLVEAFRAEIDQTTREWVDFWRREGLFRHEVNADLATTLMSGAYHQLAQKLLASEKRPTLERWLGFAQETFVRAFGTEALVAALAPAGARSERNLRVSALIDARTERGRV